MYHNMQVDKSDSQTTTEDTTGRLHVDHRCLTEHQLCTVSLHILNSQSHQYTTALALHVHHTQVQDLISLSLMVMLLHSQVQVMQVLHNSQCKEWYLVNQSHSKSSSPTTWSVP